jgi:hypothetical protein
MESPLLWLLISSQSINKHCHHRQFFFLIMRKFYREPSIDASYQVSYHLAKRFQRKSCFGNRPIRNKNCLWRPCLLTDQNGMSNSHRGGWFLKNLLLWNCLAKWTETWWEASMAGPLWKMLNFSRSINKHGWHRQFLFLIGRLIF